MIVEANYHEYYHELWCASLPKDVAIERLLTKRPHLSRTEAQRRIDNQMSDEDRKKH